MPIFPLAASRGASHVFLAPATDQSFPRLGKLSVLSLQKARLWCSAPSGLVYKKEGGLEKSGTENKREDQKGGWKEGDLSHGPDSLFSCCPSLGISFGLWPCPPKWYLHSVKAFLAAFWSYRVGHQNLGIWERTVCPFLARSRLLIFFWEWAKFP